jgi:hypothetical protein
MSCPALLRLRGSAPAERRFDGIERMVKMARASPSPGVIMRPTDTAITPQRINLLKQIRDAKAGAPAKAPPLYMDDLNVFARLKLVRFDAQGNLALTEGAQRYLA